MSYERMLEEEERLKEEIEQMLEEAEATDREEDERFGRENRGDELPEELGRQRDRLEQIQEARADLEKEAKQGRAEEVQAKADRAKERAKSHESKRERKRSETLAEKWEKQAEQLRQEADRQAGKEVPEEQTPEGMPKHRPRNETDGTPKPKAQRNFTDPDSRIMEKGGDFLQGYNLQGYNCQLLVDEANQIIVAQGVTNNAADNGNFGPMVEKGTDNAEASPEAVLADSGYWSEEAPEQAKACGTEAYIATGRQPHGKKDPTCSGEPPKEASAQEQMSHKLRTREGLDRYALRKSVVEPVNGQIKEIGGFRRFSLQGYRKVRREWALVCTGHNLKKLIGAMQAGQCGGRALG